MKILLSIIAIMLTTAVNAKEFTVKEIGDKEEYFPYLTSISKQSVAKNINTYLHLNYLELLPKSYKKSPFEKVNKDGGMPRFMVHSFDVSENKKFVSLYMRVEGCGAYCEEADDHLLFLAQSGKHVPTKALFSKRGLHKFNEVNHKKIQQTIKDFLKKEEYDDDEQRELYQECLQKDYKGKIHEETEFSISKNRLTIYSGRCSNHAMRALDDIGDFANTYALDEVKNYLSPLGHYLLDPKVKVLKNTKMVEGIYRGKIANKYPIGLFIQRVYDDGSLSAMYWYKKYRQPIELDGHYENGTLKLYVKEHSEVEKKWISVESFVGTLKNNRFQGTWTNLRSGKSSTFDLK